MDTRSHFRVLINAATLLAIIALLGTLPGSAFSQNLDDQNNSTGTATATAEDGESSQASDASTSLSASDSDATSRERPQDFGIPVDNLGDEVVGDFVVGPGKIELILEPGESKTVELLVSNRMGDLREFNFEIEDAIGSDNPDRPVVLLGDDRGPYTVRDYIDLPSDSFLLPHGKRARVPVTVRVPEDAEPGGHYGSVLVTTLSREAEAGDTAGAVPQSAIVSRIGTLFFVTIPGEVDRSGKLEEFRTIPEKKWYQSGPIRFELLYRNTGSVHVNPYGEITITNMFGEEVGYVELDPWFALPGSLRFREVTWNREFLFGKYTAVAEINRGYENIVDTQEYTLWVIPLSYIGGAFLVLFIVFFLLRTLFRNFEFRRKS